MRGVARTLAALVLCAGLCACGSDGADSAPPPGVQKNPNRTTEVIDAKKNKKWLIDGEK